MLGGLDYFIASTLTGHDTSYGPDGDGVNERDGCTWDDANEAINQPGLEPRLLAGVNYRFGE